jgi:cysteine desulfurase
MFDSKQLIYFDYNSTTPVDSRVLEAMLPFLTHNFANPSSSHPFGKFVNEEIVKARCLIANLINAESRELIFTSGATESVNIAIKGVAESYARKGKHIVTVKTEHKAVLDTLDDLENRGFEVTYLPVQTNGLIELSELQKVLRKDTILVTVMLVNNETGVIQPLKEIVRIAHDFGALVMTDATQAVGKMKVDVVDLGVDLLCFSGHKMYAPKGIGALYVRQRDNRVQLTPLVFGGGQEKGLRSGTLNVPGIIALAKACEIANEEMEQIEELLKDLIGGLERELLKLPNTYINGGNCLRLFNTTNICFQGQDANTLIGRIKNVAFSNGSACSSSIIEPSHVLLSMGLSNDDAFGSIRFSLGKYNTKEEIEIVLAEIKALINPTQNNA